MTTKKIRLAWGSGIGPDTVPPMDDRPWFRPEIYSETLQMVERAGVEFATLSEASPLTFNPMILVSALSTQTTTLGLVPELRTTDYPPFKMARLIGTLTHVTTGRIGWAMDTSVTTPGQYQYDMAPPPEEAQRHQIAAEYVEVCDKLWHSWAPGALKENAETGIFADPTKVQPINHVGPYFRVRGPLNILTAPFGAPLLVQYVTAPDELAFAGRHADVAILSEAELETLKAGRAAVERGAIAGGRVDGDVKVYFSVSFQLGETTAAMDSWRLPGRRGLVIRGSIETAVEELERAFAASGCDGIVIQSDWEPVQANVICNQIVPLLRRRGYLAPVVTGESLRKRILQ